MSNIDPISDPKVTRHCEFDTFVTRVDKRMKHASGLAIHKNPENVPNNNISYRSRPPIHKSKFYIQQEKEMKLRKIPDQQIIKNQEAKKKVAKELESRLRQYQKKGAKGEYFLDININQIDIPPDPREMAFFRYCYLMRNEQQPMYSAE